MTSTAGGPTVTGHRAGHEKDAATRALARIPPSPTREAEHRNKGKPHGEFTASEVATYYRARVPGLKKHGSHWRGPCPIHNGEDDNFAVDRKSGRWYCHSQCGRGGGIIALEMALTGADFKTARDAVLRIIGRKWRTVAYYPYTDETGKPLSRVIRLERGEGAEREKTFRQERNAGGRWVKGLGDIRRVPYRLHRVVNARSVLVVEGEKDVDTVRQKLRLVATTNPMGAGKWMPDYNRYFNGKHVIILPDNDGPGRAHAAAVAASLLPVAASVRVLELPHLPEKGDVTDWVEAGGSRAELLQLIRSTKRLDPPALSALVKQWGIDDSAEEKPANSVAQPLAAIEALQPGFAPSELESALRAVGNHASSIDPLQREMVRDGVIRKLKDLGVSAPGRLVDAALSNQSDPAQSTDGVLSLSIVEPWPEAVDGESLLTELTEVVLRFVVMPEHSAVATALWAVHAHAYDGFDCSPFLTITSPLHRCGKTRLLTLLTALVPRAVPASNITGPAIFRTIEACHPVLLIDEADTFINEHEDMRGILNSGHSRDMAYVIRLVGEDHEPRRFSTWCPKAVALIGKAPQTVQDRSIVLEIRRKTATEKVDRWRRTTAKALEPLQQKITRWVADNRAALAAIVPEVPDLGSDRAEDNWEPLLAVADVAGGAWPERARRAAARLSRGLQDDESPRVLLLADLRKLFEEQHVDRLPSETIVQALGRLEHRPWPEWKNGKPMSTSQLARELKPFGIRPRSIRLPSGVTPKGYSLSDFRDAFLRYLPQAATAATSPQKKDLGGEK